MKPLCAAGILAMGLLATLPHAHAQACPGPLALSGSGQFTDGTDADTDYPSSQTCTWQLENTGALLTLTFSRMDIEYSGSCGWDTLYVYEGTDDSGTQLAKLCGSSIPDPISTGASHMFLKFTSDSSAQFRGFEASFESSDPWNDATACPGPLALSDSGSIEVPTYAANLDCTWQLTAAANDQRVLVSIPTVDIQSSTDCTADALTVYDGAVTTNTSVLHLCGSTAPADIVSSADSLGLRFVTDGSDSGTGFTLNFQSVTLWTGGAGCPTPETLTGDGTLTVGMYLDAFTCEWAVTPASATESAKVTFSAFGIKDNCATENVEVLTSTEGGAGTPVAIGSATCGSNNPGSFAGPPGENIIIRFVSDGTGAIRNGFTMNYGPNTAQDPCPGPIHLVGSGTFTDGTDSSTNYPTSTTCSWLLYATNDLLTVSFSRLDIESHSSCGYDDLSVYEGASSSGTQLAKLCGSSTPDSMSTSNPNMFMEFSSDGSATGRGFEVSFASAPLWTDAAACPGPLALPDGSGSISVGPYEANLNCTWTAAATSTAHRLQIAMPTLSLEDSTDCTADRMTVYDGALSASPIAMTVCGSTNPTEYVTAGPTAGLRFESNADTTGSGFEITYESVTPWVGTSDACPGPLTVSGSGNITVGLIADALNCSWVVPAPNASSTPNLLFDTFGILDNTDCATESVEVLQSTPSGDWVSLGGPRCGSTSLGGFVGAPGSSLLVRLITMDSAAPRTGFRFFHGPDVAPSACSATRTSAGSGTFTDGTAPDASYDTDETCSWLLVSTEATLSLTFSRFDLEDSSSCANDAVKVYDGTSTSAPQVATLCGTSLPPKVLSSGSHLFVTFSSDWGTGGTGFEVSFASAPLWTDAAACPGPLALPDGSGSLALTAYHGNLNCTWTAAATSTAHRLRISVPTLSLEDSTDCTADRMTVYDGALSASPIAMTVCGSTIPTEYVTAGPTAGLRFESNADTPGSGLELVYESVTPWVGTSDACPGPLAVSGSGNITVGLIADALNCSWVVEGPLSFTTLSILDNTDCATEYVEVLQPTPSGDWVSMGGRHCGTATLGGYTGSSLMVRLVTMASAVPRDGLSFSHGPGTALPSPCDATLTMAGEGVFTDGSAADDRYPKGGTCTWLLIASDPAQNVVVSFGDFNVYKDYSCDDKVTVYDGTSTSASSLGEFCDREAPSVVTTGSSAFVELDSASWSPDGAYGFVAGFKTAATTSPPCNASTTVTTAGDIVVGPIDEDVVCEWTVVPPEPTSVQITLPYIGLASSPDCVEEAVEVWEGSVLRGSYCGVPSNPPSITSCTQCAALTIRLRSKGSSLSGGFRATVTHVDSVPAPTLLAEGTPVTVSTCAMIPASTPDLPMTLSVSQRTAGACFAGSLAAYTVGPYANGSSSTHLWTSCGPASVDTFTTAHLPTDVPIMIVASGGVTATVSLEAATPHQVRSPEACMTPSSSPTTHHVVTNVLENARLLLALDVDADGDIDLVSAHGYEGVLSSQLAAIEADRLATGKYGVVWFENTGGSPSTAFTLNTRHSVTTVAFNTEALAAADFDGDGDLDVAVVASKMVGESSTGATHVADTQRVLWVENTGAAGGFAFGGTHHLIASTATNGDFQGALAAGDVDGDGFVDLLWVDNNEVKWVQNAGGELPWGATETLDRPSGAPNAHSIAVGDLNGDGVDDVVAVYTDGYSTSSLYVLEHGGASWVATEVLSGLSSVADSNTPFAVVDLDSDTHQDVVLATDGDVIWVRNVNGSLVGSAARTVTTEGAGKQGVSVGDLDGDGHNDVVLADETNSQVVWVKNVPENGTAHFPDAPATYTTAAVDRVFTAVAVDVDGDGDIDIATSSFGDDKIAFEENLGTSTLLMGAGTAVTDQLTADSGIPLRLADMNGDGYLDIVAQSSSTYWYPNTQQPGAAAFDFNTRTLVYSSSSHALAVGDLNNDGAPDAVASRYSWPFYRTVWLQNDGTGASFSSSTVDYFSTAVVAVQVADLDGDGWLDIVQARRTTDSSVVEWFKNEGDDGSGGLDWSDPYRVASPEDVDWVVDVFAADLTGDGLPEVLTASEFDNQIAYFPNSGAALVDAFNITKVILSSASEAATSVSAGDLNGDGLVDVVATSSMDDTVAWFQNLGGGVFGPALIVSDTTDEADGTALADIDGDGLLDVVALSITSGTVTVFFNTGLPSSQAFSASNSGIVSTSATAVRTIVTGDLDGDGDTDVVVKRSDADATAGIVEWYEASPSLNLRTATNMSSVYAAVAEVVATRGTGTVNVEVVGEAVLDFPTASGGWLNLRRNLVIRGQNSSSPGRLHCPPTTQWPATTAMAACGGSGGSLVFRDIVFVGCAPERGLLHAVEASVIFDRIVVEAAPLTGARRLAAVPPPVDTSDGVSSLVALDTGAALRLQSSDLATAPTSTTARILTAVDGNVDVEGSTLSCGAHVEGTTVDGGAIHMRKSSVRSATTPQLSLAGTTLEGCSGDRGGAVYVSISDVSLVDTVVTGSAARQGGALFAEGFSVVTLSGGRLDGNLASESGGGVTATTETAVTATGTQFVDNTAGTGGALQLTADSVATLSGCGFTNNTATANGGCLAATSAKVTAAETSFSSCSAAESGGALYMVFSETSTAEFSDCVIEAAVAENGDGGAMYWDGQDATSPLKWSGGAIAGTAPNGRGGAVFTETLNPATATSTVVLPDIVVPGQPNLVTTTPSQVATCLTDNGTETCCVGDCAVEVTLAELNTGTHFQLLDSFNNSVSAGGLGASCALVLPSHPTIAVGAGLSSTGGGTARFEQAVVAGVVGEVYPVEVRCTIAAFPDALISDVFNLQVPACGPGSEPEPSTLTSCRTCSAGYYSPSGSSCEDCPPGTYAMAGSTECLPCPTHTFREDPRGISPASCTLCSTLDANTITLADGSASTADCVCRAGYYLSHAGVCEECAVEGMACGEEAALTVATLPLLQSYWRVSALSTSVLKCREENVCKGGSIQNDTADTLCDGNHVGPMCELCGAGFSRSEVGDCTPCETGSFVVLTTAGTAVLAVLGVAVALAVAVGIACRGVPAHAVKKAALLGCRCRCGEARAALRATYAPEEEGDDDVPGLGSVVAAKAKIAVAFLQVGGVALTEYSIPFPGIVEDVAGFFSFTNLSIFSFFQLGCKASDFDQFNRLLATTLLPVVLYVAIAAVYAGATVVLRGSRRETFQNRALAVALGLGFFVYPGVAAEIIKTFRCITFDDGSSVLRADVSISCDSPRYDSMVAYSYVMLILFPIGIPVAYLGLLLRKRSAIYPCNAGKVITVVHNAPDGVMTIRADKDGLTAGQERRLTAKVRVLTAKIEKAAARARDVPPNLRTNSGGRVQPAPGTAPAPGAEPEGALVFKVPAATPKHVKWVKALVRAWQTDHYDMELDIATREADPSVENLKFLFEDVKPRYWWLEVAELVRKFLMSAVVLLFMPETVSQTIFALVVTLVSAVTFYKTAPYVRPTDNLVAYAAHWGMFIQLFSGLCLQVNAALPPDTFSSGSLDGDSIGLLVAGCTILVPVVALAAAVGAVVSELQAAGELKAERMAAKAKPLKVRPASRDPNWVTSPLAAAPQAQPEPAPQDDIAEPNPPGVVAGALPPVKT